MDESLTIEDSKLLLELCRTGKLYAIQDWISAGKPTRVAPGVKKTPLGVAVELGFHSLVETLVRAESCQQTKNHALASAVEDKRADLVEVLVANGAEIRSVPLAEVLESWQPRLIDFFLQHGADVVSGKPFATAFALKAQKALRPFREYKDAHPELQKELQEQADQALRYFADKGDLKWVNLMLWIGADPRSRGPILDDPCDGDPECFTTAFEEACSSGHLEVLKKLKVDPARDDLSRLLRGVELSSEETIMYLLDLGANPNDKANGGSSALDRCLYRLGSPNFVYVGERAVYGGVVVIREVKDAMDALHLLISRGAIWRPDDRQDLSYVRRVLYKCDPRLVLQVIKTFSQHKTCTKETLDKLMNDRMKEHLSSASTPR